jgi:hypothetical protein
MASRRYNRPFEATGATDLQSVGCVVGSAPRRPETSAEYAGIKNLNQINGLRVASQKTPPDALHICIDDNWIYHLD